MLWSDLNDNVTSGNETCLTKTVNFRNICWCFRSQMLVNSETNATILHHWYVFEITTKGWCFRVQDFFPYGFRLWMSTWWWQMSIIQGCSKGSNISPLGVEVRVVPLRHTTNPSGPAKNRRWSRSGSTLRWCRQHLLFSILCGCFDELEVLEQDVQR